MKLDRRGLLWAVISYSMWGFFPVFWKLLADRSALEILFHRMVWSFVFYLLIFLAFSYRDLKSLWGQPARVWLLSGVAAILLASNWFLYIYAVNSGHILEGSLAYFINPIMNVAVGVLFFREPFPLVLKLSVAFAFLGVMARMMYSPGFPWISLVLASTFCAYGVTKKLLTIPAKTSSVLEGAVGLLPALIGVIYFQQVNSMETAPLTWLLFILGGMVTGLPLFLFSFSAQRISYSIMGMIQFIAPSLQFLVAVWMFNEPFGWHDLISFGLIWIGMFFFLSYQTFQRRVRTSL